MTTRNCEYVCDVLPDLLSDALDSIEAAAVRAHLQSCASCREELELARMVASARLQMPAGLEARVLAATKQRRSMAWPRMRYAMAASIAVTVIGGSALLAPYLGQRGEQPSDPSDSAVTAEPVSAGWMGVEDAFVSGVSSLGDLSVEELEKLLAEMGS